MRRLLTIAISILMLLGVTGCEDHDKKATQEIIKIDKSNQIIEAYGKVVAMNTRDLILPFPAVVEKIHVKEGQDVKVGEKIISLSIDEYLGKIQSKESEINTVRLEMDRLQQASAFESEEVERLKTELGKKKSSLENNDDPEIRKLIYNVDSTGNLYKEYTQELATKEELFKSGAISKYEVDEFKKVVQSKNIEHNNLKFSLDSLKQNKQREIDQLEQQIKQKAEDLKYKRAERSSGDKVLKEKMNTLENELTLMKNNLNKPYIKQNDIVCDFQSGIVSNFEVIQGSISNQSKSLFTLIDSDSVMVEANVDEQFIENVRIGASVSIIPETNKDKEYRGKVAYISKIAANNGGETVVPVQISIDKKDIFLFFNSNVQVKILHEITGIQ